jgi:YD repeat-containing protein
VTLPNTTVQYKYDPFGRRIEKNVNSVITRYLYDGPNVVTEYDDAGNATAKYMHNLAVDDPLALQQGASTYYYHKDGLGSVPPLTNAELLPGTEVQSSVSACKEKTNRAGMGLPEHGSTPSPPWN